uniref:Uncharacterized protein n=1 Tax=Arundo donax TaxID=35708 RepID=A0A0A9B1Q8_ARUDO
MSVVADAKLTLPSQSM